MLVYRDYRQGKVESRSYFASEPWHIQSQWRIIGYCNSRASTLENTASELNSMLSGDSYSPTEDNVETTASTVWFKLVTKRNLQVQLR